MRRCGAAAVPPPFTRFVTLGGAPPRRAAFEWPLDFAARQFCRPWRGVRVVLSCEPASIPTPRHHRTSTRTSGGWPHPLTPTRQFRQLHSFFINSLSTSYHFKSGQDEFLSAYQVSQESRDASGYAVPPTRLHPVLPTHQGPLLLKAQAGQAVPDAALPVVLHNLAFAIGFLTPLLQALVF